MSLLLRLCTGAVARPRAFGIGRGAVDWAVAILHEDPEVDAASDVVFYCPDCAAREIGFVRIYGDWSERVLPAPASIPPRDASTWTGRTSRLPCSAAHACRAAESGRFTFLLQNCLAPGL